jgi:hypothetical protein
VKALAARLEVTRRLPAALECFSRDTRIGSTAVELIGRIRAEDLLEVTRQLEASGPGGAVLQTG